ncbi:hypothetical protein TNCT_236191 [Trichonephila clavata]|uniref:Uncharacterized protein n=1 Tax=Trichonephila clavata TaxID=2740835 RepID=A0A8X6KA43_TRICU|nr:hypothetical protein TNCT_236191 [Trichonephila clavata]
MQAGQTTQDPSVWSWRRVGETFIPPKHDSHRTVEGFRAQFWTKRPCILKLVGGLTQPSGLGGGLAEHSFRQSKTYIVLWRDLEKNSGPTEFAI